MASARPIALRSPAAHRTNNVVPLNPPRLFAPGQEIYAQGQTASRLYSVEFGAVRVYRLLADGRRQISSFCLPGEVFGFEAESQHHFFADAMVTTGLRIIPRPDGDRALMEFTTLTLQCLVRTQEHLLVVGRQNAIERVAAFLIEMGERQGGLDQFDLPMSRADIGDYLGLTIETVSRVFSRLRNEGIIRLVTTRTVKIQKPGALRALCE